MEPGKADYVKGRWTPDFCTEANGRKDLLEMEVRTDMVIVKLLVHFCYTEE